MRLVAMASALMLALLLSGLYSGRAAAEDYADPRIKTALVIGFGAYQNASPLKNTVPDAKLVGARLGAAGFKVTEALDAALAGLEPVVTSFIEAAKGADIALVYYAGHAVQIDGENYMVPVDFDAKRGDLPAQLFPIRRLIEGLSKAAKVRVLLLDACRDNPFKASFRAALQGRVIGDGLAPIDVPVADAKTLPEGTQGLVVGFATQPSLVASDGRDKNGPYAKAIDAALSMPDADFDSLLKRATRSVIAETRGFQLPEYRSGLTGPLYLVSRPKPLPCDVLAAEPDNDVSVNGVEFDQIDVAAALPACEADLAKNPASPRLMHNYGKTLERSGRLADAVGYYRRAAELGYDWAQVYLAVAYLEGTGVRPDMTEGATWLRKAFEQGNRQALVTYTELDLAKIFDNKPWRVKILQKALKDAGFVDVAENGTMDEETRASLDEFMSGIKPDSKAITFQVLDRLKIVEPLFPRKQQE